MILIKTIENKQESIDFSGLVKFVLASTTRQRHFVPRMNVVLINKRSAITETDLSHTEFYE